MFHTSTSFNTDIGAWNVASVVTFMYATPKHPRCPPSSSIFQRYAFLSASAFNQDIGKWNVASATSFDRSFNGVNGATVFNRDISSWNVARVTTLMQVRH
jgi:hypothetical protein